MAARRARAATCRCRPLDWIGRALPQLGLGLALVSLRLQLRLLARGAPALPPAEVAAADERDGHPDVSRLYKARASPAAASCCPSGALNARWPGSSSGRLHVISLDDYLAPAAPAPTSAARSVIITIDDGYADNHSLALPVLRRFRLHRHGLPGQPVHRPPQRMGPGQEPALSGRPLLALEQSWRCALRASLSGVHTRPTVPCPACRLLNGCRRNRGRAGRAGSELLGRRRRPSVIPYGNRLTTSRALVEQAGFAGAAGIDDAARITPPRRHRVLQRVEILGSYRLAGLHHVSLARGAPLTSTAHRPADAATRCGTAWRATHRR